MACNSAARTLPGKIRRACHMQIFLYVFQQFTLGDEFESAYGLRPTVQTHSTLLHHDRPALNRPAPPRSVIYTARPNRPPRDVARASATRQRPNSGRKWSDYYLKPSPVHGLAAIGAALGGPESAAIRAGEAAFRDQWLSPLKELRQESGRVTVFEDSARSIAGVRQAVRLLRHAQRAPRR